MLEDAMIIELLVLVIILGLVSFIAQRLLPEPFRSIAYAICVALLLIWLLRFAGVIGGPWSRP